MNNNREKNDPFFMYESIQDLMNKEMKERISKLELQVKDLQESVQHKQNINNAFGLQKGFTFSNDKNN